MKTFKYTARHIDTDDVIEGVVQANTRDEAIAQIRDGSQVISSLEEVSASTDVTLGSRRIRTLSDGWTVVTADGSLACHSEQMIAISPSGPAEILTPR